MPAASLSELPPWLSSRSVGWGGALLAGLVLLMGAAFVTYEAAEIEEREIQRTEMLARVLEDHGNRTFDTVEVTLGALSDTLRDGLVTMDAVHLGQALTPALQGLPYIRSLSLLDAHGRVLASSGPPNVDTVVDPQQVPLPAAAAGHRLGPLVPGRDLNEAAAGHAAHGPAHHSFMAFTRHLGAPTGAPMYLTAVLNVDYFSNEHARLLEDDSYSAALATLDGVLLTATGGVQLNPGQRTSHRFFTEFLPRRERGSFIGPGLDGHAVTTAFRLLRRQPLAVMVERDQATVRAAILRTAEQVGGLCAAALAVLGGLVVMARRSLAGHASAQWALAAAQERVAASEHDLRTLVDSVRELIFRTDAQGRIGFINGRWEELSERPAAEVLGCRLEDLCLPQEQPLARALFDTRGDRPTEPRMLHVQRRDGSLRTLEVSVAAVRSPQGALVAFAGFGVDVSERQQARQKLQAQLDFTARLLEISPAPLFVKDTQGRYLSVNRAWQDLMGIPAHQAIGLSSTEVFGVEADEVVRTDLSLLASEDRQTTEQVMRRADGQLRDTVITKVRFNQADGSPAGIVGSIIDVTEFREAERITRLARDAAESANRAKSEFIANISHELRTPLQSIIGFSELGHELSQEAPELHEMFEDIHAGGQRMLRLVNALLDLSKMESKVGSLKLDRTELMTLAAQVAKELRPLADQRGLRIELALPMPELHAAVDAFRLQQVLRNVLANALRFAPAGSSIQLAGRLMDDLGVEITVADQGPGIPPDELESIFDAFTQSSRTSDGSGGTGLGLAICRKIMNAHGGRITAANRPGGGALISIRLPAPQAQAPRVLPQDAEQPSTAPATA